MTVQQIFELIKNGVLKPSASNTAWTSMYQNGQATSEQKQAYALWEGFLKNNPGYKQPVPNAQQLLSFIQNGVLKPSKTDPIWTSLYSRGQATQAQTEAYKTWELSQSKPISTTPIMSASASARAAVPSARQLETTLPLKVEGGAREPLSGQNQEMLVNMMDRLKDHPEEVKTLLQGKIPNTYSGFDVFFNQALLNKVQEVYGQAVPKVASRDQLIPKIATPKAAPSIATPPTTAPSTIGIIDKSLEDALAFLKGKGLPPDVELMFTQLLRNTPAGTELNVKEIIDQFNEIKKTTINPKFQQLSDIFIERIKSSDRYRAEQRSLELEQEKKEAKMRIEDTQADLERRGLTFSGEGVKQLGRVSAFSPALFGGPVPEGRVEQVNRMIATSSAARDYQERERLKRETEIRLGTVKGNEFDFGVPGLQNLMGRAVVGTQEQEQLAFEKDVLADLYRQESLQNEARDKITYNF